MNKNIVFFFLISIVLALGSCKLSQQSVYFKTLQADTTLKGFIGNNFESKIIKGDRLSIKVSSLNNLEDALFNGAAFSGNTLHSELGFLVHQDGTVLLHRLGPTMAEGLTRLELAKKIQTAMLAYTKEPIVTVSYLNHKVTVLGAVTSPQVLTIPDEQMSVIDALVLSGDVTANAMKKNITIIREEGNEKKVKHLNLEDHSIFTSPWYYAKPNDIIIVPTDTEKLSRVERQKNMQTTLSLVATGVSLVLVILTLIFK